MMEETNLVEINEQILGKLSEINSDAFIAVSPYDAHTFVMLMLGRLTQDISEEEKTKLRSLIENYINALMSVVDLKTQFLYHQFFKIVGFKLVDTTEQN